MNGNDNKPAAQPTAAPVDAVNYAKLYGMACEAADFAGFTFRMDTEKGVLNLLPKVITPAALGIDMHAPCTEAVYALARKLLWVAYVWNDHNFDHPYQIARKLAEEFGIESFDQANAWLDEQAKLIDASPDVEPKIWGTQKPGSMPKLFGAHHIAELNWYPDEGHDLVCMQVIERVQATSAEVGV